MRGYSGPRYGVQYTKDGNDPVMFITKEYKNYLLSLSPIEQISQAERLASDIEDKYRALYISRYGHHPSPLSLTVPDILKRVQSGAPYNTRTHTQYYYN